MGLFCFLCRATTSFLTYSPDWAIPIPRPPISGVEVVANINWAGCIYMAKNFDHDTEVAIDEAIVRMEAERRITENRISALMDNFFFEFPRVIEQEYKHRLTPSQVVNLVQQYVSAILRGKGYVQVVDKSEYPIQTYWLFG